MGFKVLAILALSVYSVTIISGELEALTQVCLGCICDAASGCNTTIGCTGDVCGPFRITKTYWADAGKPTIDGQTDGDDSAYEECVNDAQCAAKTVSGYVEKYVQDCNGDGAIDCNDFARIHHLGGFGCTGTVNKDFDETFSYCQKIFDEAE